MSESAVANLLGLLCMVGAVALGGWALWSLSIYLLALVGAGVLGAAGWRLALVPPAPREVS